MGDSDKVCGANAPAIELDSDLILGSWIIRGDKEEYSPPGLEVSDGTDGSATQSDQLLQSRLESQRPVFEQAIVQTRVRIGTLLRADNISVLIGAGCSLDCDGVSLRRIPVEVESMLLEQGMGEGGTEPWLGLFYDLIAIRLGQERSSPEARLRAIAEEHAEPFDLNFEGFLASLHTWRMAIQDGMVLMKAPDATVTAEDMTELLDRLTKALAKLCDLRKPGSDRFLQVHRDLVTKILTRPLTLQRAKLFTLNYDTLLEQAMDAEGVVALDGFVGTLHRIFRPESYDQDLYYPAQTTEGSVRRLNRVVHLYKLHGSINWHQTEPTWEDPYGLYATFYDEHSGDPVVVYPTPLKHGQTLGLPYSELFRRLATSIVQAQSVLIVIGYSFCDDHVNSVIHQALAIPSFTLVIVDPNPVSDFVKALERRRDQRVWLIKGELGKFSQFVRHILPDLREEDIEKEVVETYRLLRPDNLRPSVDEEGNGGAQ